MAEAWLSKPTAATASELRAGIRLRARDIAAVTPVTDDIRAAAVDARLVLREAHPQVHP